MKKVFTIIIEINFKAKIFLEKVPPHHLPMFLYTVNEAPQNAPTIPKI